MKSAWLRLLIFAVAFFLLSWLYHYDRIILLRPSGLHQWRQTDCLSFTRTYAEDGMHFWEPAGVNLVSDGETSGKLADECTLLYYAVAAIWQIAGQQEWIYRFLVLCLFFAGLFAYSRLLHRVTGNEFWSMAGALFLFTSPVLVYYANNFLTDVPALSLVLMAVYAFVRYLSSEKKRWLVTCALLFLLAGLLKISALMVFLLLGAVLLLETAGLRLRSEKRLYFRHRWLTWGLFTTVVAGIAGWYLFAWKYSAIHEGANKFSGIWPIWQAPPGKISEVLSFCRDILIWQVASQPAWLFFLFLIALVIWKFKMLPAHFRFGIVLLAAGTVLYLLLWFQAFNAHDYYLIALFVLPAAIYGLCLFIAEKAWPGSLSKPGPIALAVVLLAWGAWYTRQNMELRYFPENDRSYVLAGSRKEVDFYKWRQWDYSLDKEALETAEPFLDSLRISRFKKIISLPDPSFNVSLYLLHRRGWNGTQNDVNTVPGMQKRIALGAEYLVINDSVEAMADGLPAEFLQFPLGHYRNIQVYDLRPFARR